MYPVQLRSSSLIIFIAQMEALNDGPLNRHLGGLSNNGGVINLTGVRKSIGNEMISGIWVYAQKETWD